MPFKDVLMNLGDAIAGVDRDAAFYTGQKIRADIDQSEAQAEASMALAMERRRQAELDEMTKQARERFGAQAAAPDFDPSNVNIGDITLGGLGSDWSGANQGRNLAQQYGHRELVGTPEGAMLGDTIVTDDMRRAGQDALAPAAAIATRRAASSRAPVIIQGEDGPIYVDPADAIGQSPGARPSSAGSRTPTQQQNIDALVARGVPEETAIRVVFNDVQDPRRVYAQILTSTRNRFASDEEAEASALAVVEDLYGPGALEAAQQPLITPEEEDLGDELPEGAVLIGTTASGGQVYETPDGRRLVLE